MITQRRILAFLIVVNVALATIAFSCTSSNGKATPIAAGGSAFLQCGKQDLTQAITNGGETLTLLATVAKDLASGNYVAAIADLIAKVGAEAVGCAVIAVDTVVEASAGSGAGSGSASTSMPSPMGLRARELITKYGWKAAQP